MSMKVVLWGLGLDYQKMKEQIRKLCECGDLEVAGVTATTPPTQKEIDGWRVVSPIDLETLHIDKILICSFRYYREIRDYALTLPGIRPDMPVPGWMVLNKVDPDEYRSLSEQKISILSNNCWGGVISKTLCLENRSPLKNCWLSDEDYLKILQDPEHYLLKSDPVFEQWLPDITDHKTLFPQLLLDDVRIYCVHDTDPDIAIGNWMRRREKLDLDNLFVMFVPTRPESEILFSRMDRYPKKLCVVPWEPQCDISIHPKRLPGEKSFYDTAVRIAFPWGAFEYYSPVRLLLSGEHY